MKTTIALGVLSAGSAAADAFVGPLWLRVTLAAVAAASAVALTALSAVLEQKIRRAQETADSAYSMSILNL